MDLPRNIACSLEAKTPSSLDVEYLLKIFEFLPALGATGHCLFPVTIKKEKKKEKKSVHNIKIGIGLLTVVEL